MISKPSTKPTKRTNFTRHNNGLKCVMTKNAHLVCDDCCHRSTNPTLNHIFFDDSKWNLLNWLRTKCSSNDVLPYSFCLRHTWKLTCEHTATMSKNVLRRKTICDVDGITYSYTHLKLGSNEVETFAVLWLQWIFIDALCNIIQ